MPFLDLMRIPLTGIGEPIVHGLGHQAKNIIFIIGVFLGFDILKTVSQIKMRFSLLACPTDVYKGGVQGVRTTPLA